VLFIVVFFTQIASETFIIHVERLCKSSKPSFCKPSKLLCCPWWEFETTGGAISFFFMTPCWRVTFTLFTEGNASSFLFRFFANPSSFTAIGRHFILLCMSFVWPTFNFSRNSIGKKHSSKPFAFASSTFVPTFEMIGFNPASFKREFTWQIDSSHYQCVYKFAFYLQFSSRTSIHTLSH